MTRLGRQVEPGRHSPHSQHCCASRGNAISVFLCNSLSTSQREPLKVGDSPAALSNDVENSSQTQQYLGLESYDCAVGKNGKNHVRLLKLPRHKQSHLHAFLQSQDESLLTVRQLNEEYLTIAGAAWALMKNFHAQQM